MNKAKDILNKAKKTAVGKSGIRTAKPKIVLKKYKTRGK